MTAYISYNMNKKLNLLQNKTNYLCQWKSQLDIESKTGYCHLIPFVISDNHKQITTNR